MTVIVVWAQALLIIVQIQGVKLINKKGLHTLLAIVPNGNPQVLSF
jgi:hypothetical protein